jgi:sugar phosphate isomerase/epimerase
LDILNHQIPLGVFVMNRPAIPIALQLYSIHQECAADLAGALGEVARWGYDGVEFAGFHGHSAAAIKQMLGDNHLRCAGNHVKIDALLGAEVAKTMAFNQEIGCDNLVVSWLDEQRRDSPATCLETAEVFAAIADKLAGHGLATGFHCHFIDVKPFVDGTCPWDILARNTPSNFILQYDTANGLDGGADPVRPILDHPGRTILLHLKEYADGHGKAVIGKGDIPWQDVFAAAESVGGTQWYIVEQEDHPTLDPIAAARQCLEGLRQMGK